MNSAQCSERFVLHLPLAHNWVNFSSFGVLFSGLSGRNTILALATP